MQAALSSLLEVWLMEGETRRAEEAHNCDTSSGALKNSKLELAKSCLDPEA